VNVSAGHVEHAALPDIFLTVPAAHATHGPTSGPVYPELHKQLLTFLLPNNEFAFAVQFVHAALPFVDLYVPTGHILHCPFDAPVSGPVYPVLHEHPRVDEQICLISPHVVLVRSTPSIIAL
jgi:hypothetical protein